MCGIIATVGRRANAQDVLLNGLLALAYRGYDSAGMATFQNQGIHCAKAKGKVQALRKLIEKESMPKAKVGIAHTRWATHGIANTINAHPHIVNEVTLVHNGIIENYQSLKQDLLALGYQFQSDTDSEVACAYLDYRYQISKDPYTALTETYHVLEGSFAFAIMFADKTDCIYAMRKESPLVLGIGEDGAYIASDVSAFVSYTNTYLSLQHEEIAQVLSDEIIIQDLQGNRIHHPLQTTTLLAQNLDKGIYSHYMLKEIHEEKDIISTTISAYVKQNNNALELRFPDVSQYEEIHIVACGSAMYAGKVAKCLLETYAQIPTQCMEASEYRYATPLYQRKTLFLTISQSGETADSLAAMKLAKQHHIDTFAIVNVANSTMAQQADVTLLTHAGVEISVATTKAYCAQIALLSLLTLHFAQTRGYECAKQDYFPTLNKLSNAMEYMMNTDIYNPIIQQLKHHHDIFYIGRGIDYALSLEGALKLKEISYQHSEAYPAGELKHGSIALMEEGTPIIALITQKDIADKTISNIKEVKARGAYVILLHCDDIEVPSDSYDYHLSIPRIHPFLQPILTIVPFQMIAYTTANARGCEIDQPRNLAKSVTVE